MDCVKDIKKSQRIAKIVWDGPALNGNDQVSFIAPPGLSYRLYREIINMIG